jgi:hypothetical protein
MITKASIDTIVNAELDAKVVELDSQRERETGWLKNCICGESGKPLPVLANALIALHEIMTKHICL